MWINPGALTMPIRFWLVILVIVVAIAWALTKMHWLASKRG